MVAPDFRLFRVRADYSLWINAGASAFLYDMPRESNPETDERYRAAWFFGYDDTKAAQEGRAA